MKLVPQSEPDEVRELSRSRMSDLNEVIRDIRAANRLFLGVSVRSIWVPDTPGGGREDGASMEWEVIVYDDSPFEGGINS